MHFRVGKSMSTSPAPPVILIAAPQEHSLGSVLKDTRYSAAVQVHTGTLALAWAPDLRPDTIILDADLPDMSGIDACRLLHNDLRIGHNVPILILAPDKPTPEQRVTALRAGAWDFLPYPLAPEELALKLQTYVHAKRSIDLALADAAVDPGLGLHSRPALARRARELGALMTRKHGGPPRIVFDLGPHPADPPAGRPLGRASRLVLPSRCRCSRRGERSDEDAPIPAPRRGRCGRRGRSELSRTLAAGQRRAGRLVDGLDGQPTGRADRFPRPRGRTAHVLAAAVRFGHASDRTPGRDDSGGNGHAGGAGGRAARAGRDHHGGA